jgi:hypothetical protein
MAKTAAQAVQKWLDNTAVAAPRLRDGVNAMGADENPLEKAAAKETEWAAGCARAAQQNRFSKRLRETKFEDWKRAMTGKGAENYTRGVADAKPKVTRFFGALIPAQQQIRQSLPARGTLQQNITRSRQMIENMAALRYDRAAGQMVGEQR